MYSFILVQSELKFSLST